MVEKNRLKNYLKLLGDEMFNWKTFFILIFILVNSHTFSNTTEDSINELTEDRQQKENLSDTIVQKVEITNLPEETIWEFLTPYISILIGVTIGWLLSYLLQKRQIKYQFAMNENRNRISELISISSEFLSQAFFFSYELRLIDAKGNKDALTRGKFLIAFQNLSRLNSKFRFFLDESKSDEKEIIDKLDNFLTIINIESDLQDQLLKMAAEITKLDTTINKLIKKYREKYL